MSTFKRLFTLVLLIICLGVGAWFGWDNRQEQVIHLFGLMSPELPLGVLILAVLMLGVCVGLLVAQFSLYRLRLKNKSLRKQLKQRELSVPGDH